MNYHVTMAFDPEARVWYVQDSDVPGLATEAETIDALHEKLKVMVPELVALNEANPPSGPIRFAATIIEQVSQSAA